jgi:MFS family permease
MADIDTKLEEHYKHDNETDPAKPVSLKKTRWRWLALVFLFMTLAGDYYCYDNPQALQEPLQSVLNINAEEFNLLYSIYCIPNIVLPLVGGRLIDFFGVRVALILFASLIFTGQVVVALGGYMANYWVILVGRGIYGLGGDCMTVSETFFITQWFGGSELAFAFSFQDVINGIASAINAYLSPYLYEKSGTLGFPLMIGAIVCGISLLSTFAMVTMDKINDKREGNEGAKTFIKDGEGVNFKDLFKFPLLYWLIILNYGFQSGAFYNFTNVANDYLVTRYDYSATQAGMLIAFLIYAVGGVFPPLWGWLVDTFGYRVFFILGCGLLPFTAHLLFLTSHDCTTICWFPIPILPLLLLGLYISMSDSLTYPTFPVFLPERKYSTAFAGALILQNIMLVVGPSVVGLLLDDAPNYDTGYVWVSGYLLANSATGLIFIAFMYFVDRKQGSRLQLVHEEFDPLYGEAPLELAADAEEKEGLQAEMKHHEMKDESNQTSPQL